MPATERTGTAPATYHHRVRAVEAMAFSLLCKRGYSVIRSMRYSSAVHLVAWCDWSRPLFVHVKRTRLDVAGAIAVSALWRDDLAAGSAGLAVLRGAPGRDHGGGRLCGVSSRMAAWRSRRSARSCRDHGR